MVFEFASMRKRIHHPAYADAYKKKQEERPKNVLEAIVETPPPKEPERHGDYRSKKQKSLKMRKRHSAGHRRCHHALRPRAASYACNAASKFNTPAVARNRVP